MGTYKWNSTGTYWAVTTSTGTSVKSSATRAERSSGDGVVTEVTTVDDDDTPESYVSCIAEVIAKADFDGHDLPDGMEFTYPLNVSW